MAPDTFAAEGLVGRGGDGTPYGVTTNGRVGRTRLLRLSSSLLVHPAFEAALVPPPAEVPFTHCFPRMLNGR